MLKYDQLESVNVEVWRTWILLLSKILALAIFDGPTQSGFDQLSQQHWRGGGGVPPLLGAIPGHWYKLLDDKNLTSTRRISPEFADFMARYPDVVALTSVASSTSEFIFFNSLVSNIV